MRATAGDDGDDEQRESVRLWRVLGGCTRGDPRVVVMGDMNAETMQALRRHGRKASWQDAAWQKVIKQSALSVKSVGRATYRETSEIDYIAAGGEAAQRLFAPEWRQGQHKGDHGAVWVRVAEDEGHVTGARRPGGLRLQEDDGWTTQQWEEYRSKVAAAWIATREELDEHDPIATVRHLQSITHGVAEQQCKTMRDAAHDGRHDAQHTREDAQRAGTPAEAERTAAAEAVADRWRLTRMTDAQRRRRRKTNGRPMAR